MTPVLLLSDLHLPPQPSPYREAFARFLDGPARTAASVYILGDLFDAWVGDDIGLQAYAADCTKLAAVTAAGVPVYFQHGNRDFLIGPRFASFTGVTLLPEYHVADYFACGRFLLTHGDALCVDDVVFQRFRHWTQQPWLQRLFLSLPAAARRAIATRLQQASSTAKSGKSAGIMDVNDNAVREIMARYAVARMIHGHTHRPGHYRLIAGNASLERIVLPDWRPERMEYLVCDANGTHTETL